MAVAAAGERETLLALQCALPDEQFQAFKYLLEGQIPLSQLRPATRPDLCSLLLQHFPGQALRKAGVILRQLSRLDLIQRFQLPGAEDVLGSSALPGVAAGSSGMSAGEDAAGASEGAGWALPSHAGRPHGRGAPCFSPAGERRLLTERDLMQVAQKTGREWQEVGIQCLGLEKSRLEQIREDNPNNVVMQVFEMLREWLRREKQHATAPHLHACLAQANVNPEVLTFLQSIGGV
uniref:Death domain-containing protein n=1 Tax=Apteryx owenii TaxID=8824 RepID=A0A8B9P6G2_APTOW